MCHASSSWNFCGGGVAMGGSIFGRVINQHPLHSARFLSPMGETIQGLER
jgi:hypothetical protein